MDLEIWTEDSTAGFIITSMVMKRYFNKDMDGIKVSIVPHNSVWKNKSDDTCKFGGLADHIESLGAGYNKCIVIMADATTGFRGQPVEYVKLKQMADRHWNIFFVDMHSFEACMLSYKNLPQITGYTDTKVLDLIAEFNSIVSHRKGNIAGSKLETYMYKNNLRNSEKLAKNLLATVTNNGVRVNGKVFDLAMIARGKVGICWKVDCCNIGINLNSKLRKCNNMYGKLHSDKIDDLINNSYYADILRQIKNCIKVYNNRWAKYKLLGLL